jgi:hypothetical protein
MKKMVFETLKTENRKGDSEFAKTKDYEQYNLNNDMGDGDTFTGQPHLSPVFENDYGKSANISISNHETEERLNGRVKVQTNEDTVEFWDGSLGYDIIKSIKELNGETIHPDDNKFTISFRELQEFINKISVATVKVINHTAEIRNEVMNWNTLIFTKIGE